MVKKITSDGMLYVPKTLREQLPSNELKMSVEKDKKGNPILVCVPVNITKKPIIKYE